MNDKENKVEEFMNKVIDEYEPAPLSEEDKEFEKYCKLYEEKFGKKPTSLNRVDQTNK